ncbi:gastrula zinc finger protein XlCGF26.1-like [Bicyclus anynana]|uniref:Gastrula zinc finger protein XlCGF26.1-like n=1 Tax=Bicyclus anynana TaxID=110368 RepID=A0ABM3LUP8_BICAN|nr:gastrula zinc finger protein XlCGF26.1-like [Bicyclus anynana]
MELEKAKAEHCRFCAEPKSSQKMLDILSNEKYEEVTKKLEFLNYSIYVNLHKDKTLPKTVCFVCYDSLNKAYDFLDKVKRAQTILHSIYPLVDDNSPSDDGRVGFDETSDIESAANSIKLEEPADNNLNLEIDLNIEEVKTEPKDEIDVSQESDCYEQNFNVQDILNAAMCKVPYPEATLYAKEVVNTGKKSISSWKDYPWICSHCDIEFLDVGTLRLHTKLTHSKCSAFVCIDCDSLGSKDFNGFIKHVKIHRKKLRKRCHYCDESINEDSLPYHIEQHFQKIQVSCPDCGEILKNNESLQKHLREYNSKKPKRKPRRKRGTPLTIEDLTCGLCKKVYKNPNSLRDHMKIHTNDRKRNYTCDRCGKMFYNKGTLTSHIMAHDKVRPHVCRICNRSFLFPNMLRRHVEMHSGVKPFSCEQCGRCFRLQYQLNAHKIIHTDSMPHVCQYCNKAFRFKQILKNHERQHTGAKPYACQSCSMEFTNWSNYNKHMKRRHNLDTSKKKITPEGVFPINPQTGELVQFNDAATEEWKTKIMIPGKRGKKKVIKKENTV